MSENKYDDEAESDSDDEYDHKSKDKKWKLSVSHKGTNQNSSVDYKIKLLKKVNRARPDDEIQECIGQIILSFDEKDDDGFEIRKVGTGTVYKRLYDKYILVITCCHNMVQWNDHSDRKQMATRLWYLPKGIEDDSVRLKCIKWIGNEHYKPRIDHCPNDIGIILCRDTNNYYGNVLQKDINEIIRVGKSQRNKLIGCGIYGYPAEANGILMGMMGKAETKDNEWKYVNINTYPGQSGAAVYKEDDDEIYSIYGVHTFGDVEKQINRAVKINDKHIKWIQMVEDKMKQKADEDMKKKQRGKKTKKDTKGDGKNEVERFLHSIGLSHYCWSFEEQGCTQMANLKFIKNEGLKQVFGVHNLTERKIILNGIREYFQNDNDTKLQKSKGAKKICKLTELKTVGVLGKGKFGLVTLVQDPFTGKSYALKSIKKYEIIEAESQKHIISEKLVMEQLSNKFLVNLHTTYKDKLRVYFLLDAYLGGNLSTVLTSRRYFNEPAARYYAASICEGIDYLHSFDIIHRDLRPENLMLDSKGHLKIIDFGLSKKISDKTYTLCGEPNYISPEIVTGQGHGKGVDWWALGIIIYEMLASFPPFVSDEPSETYRKIIRGRIRFPRYFNQEVRDLIRGLLHPKPTRRLGVLKGGANNIRKHIWYENFDYNKLLNGSMRAPIINEIKSNTDISNFQQIKIDDQEARPIDPKDDFDSVF